jgi:hypothetical protein
MTKVRFQIERTRGLYPVSDDVFSASPVCLPSLNCALRYHGFRLHAQEIHCNFGLHEGFLFFNRSIGIYFGTVRYGAWWGRRRARAYLRRLLFLLANERVSGFVWRAAEKNLPSPVSAFCILDGRLAQMLLPLLCCGHLGSWLSW